MQVNSEQDARKPRLSMCCHWEARGSVFETSSVVASPSDPTSRNPPKLTKQRATSRDNVVKLEFRSDREETVDNCQTIEFFIRIASKPRQNQAWLAYLKARLPQ
jgi:hypothetical protein